MAEHLLPLAKIRVDGGTQLRVERSAEKIERFAEDMKNGDKFPDSTVFHDGKEYWMSDGHSRHEAAGLAGRKTLNVKVKKGTREDAIIHAASCNHTQGEGYTRADRRNAVKGLLRTKPELSNNAIAKRCRVSDGLVAKVREEVEKEKPAEASTSQSGGSTRTGSDGKQHPTTQLFCRQCRVFGPNKGCPDCKIIRQNARQAEKKAADAAAKTSGSGRSEPGDDTASEAAAKAATKARQNNGKPELSWKDFEKSIGIVVRFPNVIKDVFKEEKMSSEYHDANDLLERLVAVMKVWKKRLQKAK